jgi:hypothetical protein
VKVIGKNGSMELTETSVIISRKEGGMSTSFLLMGQGDKAIDIKSITALQLKEPGLLAGHLRLSINGRDDTRPFADGDENAVMFGSKCLQDFIRLRDAITARMSVGRPEIDPGVNLAEELERLAVLRAQGLLTDTEYAAAKSKVIG